VAAFGAVLASANSGPSLGQPATIVPTAPAARPTPIPSVVPGPLNGLPTSRRIAERRPLAAMVDNFYPDALPQTGLSRASVVFDALTEGGITRLMALFLEHDATRIGPIRSARAYFVSWAAGFRALFVHAGGSPSSLQLLPRTPSLIDLDALRSSTGFSRESDRPTPHDLYGSTSRVRAAAQRRGANVLAPSAGLAFGRELPLRSRGRSSSFVVTFSTPAVSSPPAYSVTYRYVRARNVYLRSQGGAPFVDRATHVQIAPKNVIVLYAHAALVPNDPLGRISLAAVGGGRATLFQNGHTVQGRWSKASTGSPLSLTRSDGQPMTLVPGQTWIEVTAPGDLALTPPS
jgi:hypothetical protein